MCIISLSKVYNKSCQTSIKFLENSIFSHFVYCQAEKTICFMWYLMDHHVAAASFVLDPAFKLSIGDQIIEDQIIEDQIIEDHNFNKYFT